MDGLSEIPAIEGAIPCHPELDEVVSLSFGDSFFNFDSISGDSIGDWLMEGNLEAEVGACGKIDSEIERQLEKVSLGAADGVDGDVIKVSGDGGVDGNGIKVIEVGSEGVGCVDGNGIKVSDDVDGNGIKVISEVGSEGVGCVDGNGIKVSDGVDGNGIKVGEEDDVDVKSEGGSSSSSSSAASSSSSSSAASSSSSSSSSEEESDSGEEEDSGEKKIDVEEGEILLSDADVDAEEMVGWSDNEDGETGMTGPITSKNELRVLPPVPSVSVTLQPHHETLPVGIILSIVGAQVIVEGVENHKPLNEGSILWITESRIPLGIIDEIFGPVKTPYYIVRYNSETEVPAGIQQDTSISFVQEFADHVLNNKNLYQKGYDASGENDEELSDELEFSDDEKEAEYRRMLKMKKRGTNESKPGNKRKEKRQQKNRAGNWNNDRDPASSSPLPPVAQSQHDNISCSSGPRQDLSPFPHGAQAHPGFTSGPRQDMSGGNNQAMISPFPQPGFVPPNGIWSNTTNNGFPPQQQQQQQGMGLPNGLPPNGLLWMQQQNMPFQMFQTPLQTAMGFQQHMGMVPGLPFNFNAFGGQPNFVGGAPRMLTPWPTTSLNPNTFNVPQFGMAFQGSLPPQNGGGEEPQFGMGFQGSLPPQNGSVGEPQFGMGFQGTLPPQNGGRGEPQIGMGLQGSLPQNGGGGEQGGGRPQGQGPQNSGNSQSSPDSLNFSQGTRGGRRGGRQHHRGGRGRNGGGRGRYQSH